ncbi:MAG: hypothetical protein A7316_04720 [Candidatus Altiarchaeales archaeon WOR_SM1_86-2]|nr:MAG: hypothetical protein A7316_04720 [Candidatus Altiarchaeales archaeon WOR_SM1_86-2]ODS41685.1 MAG: hypothetical protein A7315_00700 [Candidatus Altiarchaeales archaeon WOR_SM1_79]
MEKPRLFTVGPTWVRDDVLKEMSRQMFSHRSGDYVELHKELIAKLKKFLGTENDVLLYTSSSTGVMESAARNCISEGGKALTLICGAFGERFGEIVEQNGRKVLREEVDWGKANTPESLDAVLAENNDVEAVTITHCETSTALLNPLKDLVRVAKQHGVLTLVDAVSSMGGVSIDVNDIDVCFFGVQKCMSVPPGLAVASVSDKALEKAREVENRGHYFDFLNLKKYNDKHMVPYTPPIPQMFALSKTLDIIGEEGRENRFATHRKVSARVREGVKELGFEIFTDERYLSPTLSCVSVPGEIDLPDMMSGMRKRGFILASGYGRIKDSTFRVGNMGNVTMDDVDEMLENLAEVV